MKDQRLCILHEKAVAGYINHFTYANAENPTNAVGFSDILISFNNRTAWLETKMTVDSNMINTRVRYLSGIWTCRGMSPVGDYICQILANSDHAKGFIHDMTRFVSRDMNVDNNWPSLSEMTNFMKHYPDHYIHWQEDVDISEILRLHYLKSKSKCTHYLQAGDNFYKISEHDPLGLSSNIPVFTARGTLKVRVSLRSKRYEMQAEVKVKSFNQSEYSVFPFTSKKCPFA